MVSGILPTSSISVGNHGCDTGVRYASLFFDRCCGSRKKRSLPTPRGKISFFLRFDEPLSLRESGVLKSPYRNLKKTDTPVWVCPFAFIKFFEYRGTLRSRIFRTLRAFGEKSRVLETTQSAAAARRCGCFDEPLSLRESGVLKSPYRNLKKTDTPVWVCPFLAAIQGFEPRQAESEAAVLPLHYIAIPRLTYQAFILYYILKICQGV